MDLRKYGSQDSNGNGGLEITFESGICIPLLSVHARRVIGNHEICMNMRAAHTIPGARDDGRWVVVLKWEVRREGGVQVCSYTNIKRLVRFHLIDE